MAPTLACGMTQMFRVCPVADLRTPRTTFDTYCRSILTENAEVLWQTLHPDLRPMMQRRLSVEGVDRFFGRMKPIISSEAGRLRLGDPIEVSPATVVCPLYRGSNEVGKAWFAFHLRQWVLSQLT